VLDNPGGPPLVYARHGFPWPVKDRHYVATYRWEESEEGFELLAEGVADHPAAPDTKAAFQMRQLRSRWQIRPAGPGTTRAVYTYRGDIGGSVPRGLIEWSWRRNMADTFERLEALALEVAPPPTS
jgi:hypothetical protein